MRKQIKNKGKYIIFLHCLKLLACDGSASLTSFSRNTQCYHLFTLLWHLRQKQPLILADERSPGFPGLDNLHGVFCDYILIFSIGSARNDLFKGPCAPPELIPC